MRFLRARRLALMLSLTVFLPAAPAQGKTRFEDPAAGYRIYVSKAIKAVPTEPNERQALAKWGGTLEFKDKKFRGKDDCSVMLVRIAKSKGPTTGPRDGGPKEEPAGDDESADKPSIRSQSIEQLNSGTTVVEFLKKRGYKHDLIPVTDERPVESKDGQRYVVNQCTGQAVDRVRYEVNEVPIIRTYLIETEQEFFGLVAFGAFLDPWRDIVEDMAKSLQRIELGASNATGSGAEFGNADFREQVRSKLVKGWEAYDTDHFILVTNSTNKGVIDDILCDLELMRMSYIQRFPPAEGVDLDNVISAVRFCKTFDDYVAYGGPPHTAGYWNFRDEELVLVDIQTMDKKVLKDNPNLKNMEVLDILHHEAMHQYFFYANGNLAPASWFNEGFGEVFGGAVPDRRKGEIKRIEKNKFRMAWIKQCQRIGRWPSLNAFLKMTQGEFYGASSMQNYAFGWAFCYFLEEQRQDPKGNRDWGALPDKYLHNLRAATAKKKKELGVDDKDKEWLIAFTNDLQEQAYHATFDDVDRVALEEAWIDTMKGWKR